MEKIISLYEHIDNGFVTKDVDDLYEAYVSEAESFKRKPTDSDIVKAVKNRNFVGIYYEEPDIEGIVKAGFRLIEPYAYGSNKDGSRRYIRAFVIKSTDKDENAKKPFKTKRKSASKTKRLPYWRLFRVDRIQDWQTFPWKFSGYRELYKDTSDKHIANIFAIVPKTSFPKGEINVNK